MWPNSQLMGYEWDIWYLYMNGISILIYIKPTIICQLSQLDMMMDLSEHRVPQNPRCIILNYIKSHLGVYPMFGHRARPYEIIGMLRICSGNYCILSGKSTTQSIGLGETAAGNPWIFPLTAARPTRWNSSVFFFFPRVTMPVKPHPLGTASALGTNRVNKEREFRQ